MRLNKITGHALRILIYCAREHGRSVKVQKIARYNQISTQNAYKITNILVQGGFLEAVRGPKGGVLLARPAEEICIGDVVRVTEATNMVADCFGGAEGQCTIKQIAPVNLMLDSALEAFISVLDLHSIADFTKGNADLSDLAIDGPAEKPARTGRKTVKLRPDGAPNGHG